MSSQEALEVFSLHCREIQSTQLPTRTAMGNSGSSLALLNRKVCTEASTTGAGKEGISIRHNCQAAPKGTHTQRNSPDPWPSQRALSGPPSLSSCLPCVIFSHKARASRGQDNMASLRLGLGQWVAWPCPSAAAPFSQLLEHSGSRLSLCCM